MNARFIIAASTVVSCYFLVLVGDAVYPFFAAMFGTRERSDLAVLMPQLTQFAIRYSWAFAFAAVLIGIASALLSKRYPARILHFVTIDLSAQGLVVWFAMFCYCYDNFLGPVSLHHPQWFDFPNFFRFDFGVFPVTLCAILTPAFSALLSFNEGRD